jgi:hypothetical protein
MGTIAIIFVLTSSDIPNVPNTSCWRQLLDLNFPKSPGDRSKWHCRRSLQPEGMGLSTEVQCLDRSVLKESAAECRSSIHWQIQL